MNNPTVEDQMVKALQDCLRLISTYTTGLGSEEADELCDRIVGLVEQKQMRLWLVTSHDDTDDIGIHWECGGMLVRAENDKQVWEDVRVDGMRPATCTCRPISHYGEREVIIAAVNQG